MLKFSVCNRAGNSGVVKLDVLMMVVYWVKGKGSKGRAVMCQCRHRGGNRGIALLIPNRGTRWLWLINAMPQPLNPERRTLVSIL